jgi:hypothetical protein
MKLIFIAAGELCLYTNRNRSVKVRSLLGMWGVRSSKIGVVCDRCLGILGCDRLKLGGCVRSLFGDVGVRSFKIRVVSDRCLGCWGAIV